MQTLLVPPDDVLLALKTSDYVAKLQQAPDAAIHVLCADPNKALFECIKGVQTVHCWTGENHVGVLRSQLQVARKLRKVKLDQVIVNNPQRRWPALVLAMGSVSHSVEPVDSSSPVVLQAPNIDSRYIRRKFGVSALMPMVIFHQQQLPQQADWPTRYWVELINLLAESGPYQAVFLGTTAQRGKATEICAISNMTVPSHNLCGLTSLRDTLGLIACTRICVGTTDLHTQLSVAMGSKTVAMASAPLTVQASPMDVLRAIESTLAGDPSHTH